MNKNKKKISIVLPAYNEAESLPEAYKKITKVMKKNRYNYEIIVCDDGSTDKTLKILERINKADKKLKVISLAKNCGKAVALQEGFNLASGSYIITMDSDLQDDPEEIPYFVEMLKRYDFVNGRKIRKWKGNLLFAFLSIFFNFLTTLATGLKIRDFNCPFKGYRAKIAKKLNLYGSLHRYIPALVAWQNPNANICEIKVKNFPRKYGKSKYSIWKMKGFFDLITIKFLTRFSAKPLHLFGSIGFLSIFVGFIICLILLVRWIVGYSLANNMPLLLLGILLLVVGIQVVSLGLLAEMIARKYPEKPQIKRILR
jgi:glycosyltransferase involved in cell wall biosynthesis